MRRPTVRVVSCLLVLSITLNVAFAACPFGHLAGGNNLGRRLQQGRGGPGGGGGGPGGPETGGGAGGPGGGGGGAGGPGNGGSAGGPGNGGGAGGPGNGGGAGGPGNGGGGGNNGTFPNPSDPPRPPRNDDPPRPPRNDDPPRPPRNDTNPPSPPSPPRPPRPARNDTNTTDPGGNDPPNNPDPSTLAFTSPSTCSNAEFSSIVDRIAALAAQDTFDNNNNNNNGGGGNNGGDGNGPLFNFGRVAPNMIRLMFHACGTFHSSDGTGGCEGGWMRFGWIDSPNSNPADNDGLQIAIAALNTVKSAFPCITYADLWTLSAAVAIKVEGGPQVRWRPGRRDALQEDPYRPILSHRLPSAEFEVTDLQAMATTLGLTERELVALIGGGHSQGHAFDQHAMGYFGSWTSNPRVFSDSEFFQGLVSETWVPFHVNRTGEDEFVARNTSDPQGRPKRSIDNWPIFRLPSDMALLQAPLRQYVDLYAGSPTTFTSDFAAVVEKVSNLGSTVVSNGFVYGG